MKRTSWAVLVLALLVMLVVSVADAAQARAVTKFNVFAAASLNKAFPAEAIAFKKAWPRYKDVRFVFNFQGTDTLVAQIEQGAPADVFAGASLKYGDRLYNTDHLILAPVSFCQNRLCVIVPAANPAGIATLADVATKSDYIAVGSSSVPIGSYTGQVLDKMVASGAFGSDYKTAVMSRAVTCLNVTQVTSLVMLDEVDAGFVYVSDAKYAADRVKKLAIPAAYQSNPLPTYPIARTTSTVYPRLSQRFISFLLSVKGQQILRTWGFLPKPAAMTAAAQ
jgi:molybdate transport system substrate-binding protein